MQPYFLPYIGYWQLISAVEKIVIYDNIKYTKKGWINRNRFLQNDKESIFSVPLKKDSDYLNIAERRIADNFKRNDLTNQLREAYRKAPYFKSFMPILADIINYKTDNLFEYILNSIKEITKIFEIKTEIIISSSVNCDHTKKSKEKVQEICAAINAKIYINAIGGIDLYSKQNFETNKLKLLFLKTKIVPYKQNAQTFIPNLSIVDLFMFLPLQEIKNQHIPSFELI